MTVCQTRHTGRAIALPVLIRTEITAICMPRFHNLLTSET